MSFFQNDAVDIANLPQAEAVELQPIHPSYKKVIRWEWMIGWGITWLMAAICLFFINALHTPFRVAIIAGPLLLLGFFSLWVRLQSFKRKAYAVREKDLIYRSGWIVQRLSVCPFSRIQHCSVSAGPFERKLGLASLAVYTAGSQGSDITIPGLTETDAFALRDFIMKKTSHDGQS